MNDPLTLTKTITEKNKLDNISIELTKLVEFHNELKYLLEENTLINNFVINDELFLEIEKKLKEITIEIDNYRKSI